MTLFFVSPTATVSHADPSEFYESGAAMPRIVTAMKAESRITRRAWELLSDETPQCALARSVLLEFDSAVRFQEEALRVDNLPEIECVRAEGGAILLEWTFPEHRLVFAIEAELAHSSWHFASKEDGVRSGPLDATQYAALAEAWRGSLLRRGDGKRAG